MARSGSVRQWRLRGGNHRGYPAGFALALAIAVTLGPVATAHETDQFTIPTGREVAELGPYLNKWFYDALANGVERTNDRIRQALARHGDKTELADLQAPMTIAVAVNNQLPDAYNVIEGLNRETLNGSMKSKYPGKVIGYKQEFVNIYQHVYFLLDPRQIFRIWLAGTIKVDGVYLGTDKIGHFIDMGMHYYRGYRQALAEGRSERAAMRAALEFGQHGLIFSETGMLGYLSAGDYSNADLAADYLGLLFYRNLTEPVRLKGRLRPPMLVHAGSYWRIAPYVKRGSNFFSYFISEHLDEALNPGLFEKGMRPPLRTAVAARTADILWRYRDRHGCRRSPQWFNAKALDLSTYYGADYGHRGSLDQLITVGNTCYQAPDMARPTGRNAVGQTPLHWTVLKGDLPMARHLLDQGANVNAPVRSDEPYSASWGDTPLHLAAREGQLAIARLLIARGADVNARNDRGVTALHLASHHVHLADLLLAHGAKVNAVDNRGRTPLAWAAVDPRSQDITVLLGHHADVHLADHTGLTPLHLAAKSGSLASVQALIAHGADPNARARLGLTPLNLAAERTDGGLIVTAIIDGGAKVAASDAFGWTALDDAARHGSESAGQALIAHGADVNHRNADGDTPLHLACRYEHARLATLLMFAGADVMAQDDAGNTPMHEAALAGDWGLVHALLSRGAGADVRNVAGLTPAQLAAKHGFATLGAALVTHATQRHGS